MRISGDVVIPCLSHSLNSATAAKSPARESGGTWSFFSNLEEPDIMSAILVFSDKKKKKKRKRLHSLTGGRGV